LVNVCTNRFDNIHTSMVDQEALGRDFQPIFQLTGIVAEV